MKKSVRIRKAGPNETPGYYNKTAKFLNKALPKAKVGMQMGNGLQDKMKVIMLDTYTALRDGADPQEVFRKLLMDYGMPQEMAYQVMQTIMAKLAKDGYNDPAMLEQNEQEQQAQAPQQESEPSAPVAQNQNPGTPDEDEELALSMSEDDTGYDAMEHYNNRNVEQEEEQSAFAYGGYYDDGGEYDDYASNSVEDTVIDQYSSPGQLSMEQKLPMSIEDMLRSFNLPSNATQTPDLNAYLQGMYNYQNVGSDDIPNDLLPTAKHGGAHIKLPLARNGRPKKTVTPPPPPPVPEVNVKPEPKITVEPQETIAAKPGIVQGLQNAYYAKNALAPQRGLFGTTAQIIGTGVNYIRPKNWKESSTALGLIGGREEVRPSTTATKTYEDVYKILMDKDYKPETLVPNEDGTFSSGLAFNMGPELYEMLSKEILADKSIQSGLKKNGVVQLEFPTSSVPELNFLSLHNEKSNTQIRLVRDANGFLKIELVTDIKTPLKGLDKNSLTIKDEFVLQPETGQLVDVKTGMPLDQIQKSYYKGNELNWYNQSYTFPFTKKYGNGLDLSQYPTVVSGEPLKQTPGSRWNVFNNLITKPAIATPYILPFTYPGFAARNKFYPESKKVTVDYFGRARELGPQTVGGMTFGDQPFGAQYADYNLQANRNYLTGRNFLIGAGLLGTGIGGATYYYNRDTDDWEVGSEQQNYKAPTIKNPGFGYSFDINKFGRQRPAVDYKENNYGLDSMYINNGDTIHDKGWGELAPSYKAGGAHKKKFLKRMQQVFEPGGEAQDPSLGKGSRMDDGQIAKKKQWIGALKKQSDNAANGELYDLIQKSGDQTLMNIFMNDGQSNQGTQQPMPNRQMAEGGDPCPEGSYWDEYKGECVPYSQGVPSREELFNSPEMLDYLNKLNRKRNVQDYKEYRQDKIREYRNQNYKGPMKETEDGTPYPDRESPEWKEFQKSEEFQKFINSYPNPDYDKRFQFPNDFKQKDYYPQEGDWDEKSKEEYNRLFNPEPDRYEQRGINMDIYIEQHPELRQQLEELREQQKWEEEDELQKQIYESIPEEEKNRKPSPQDLRKERYNDWCPCYKTQEIIVQGQPVQHRICVPCEQAQVGGFVNMSSSNPLTRFIYGGNEPDYYEQNNLPEARDGVSTPPVMKYDEWFKDYTSQDNWPGAYAGNEPGDNTLSTDPNEATAYHQWMQDFNNPSPEAEGKRFDAYQGYLNFRNEDEEDEEDEVGNLGYKVPVSGSNNTTTHNCPPGTKWIEKYNTCVPIMKTNYNPRVVSGDPGLHNILLPWNPIFRTRGYKTRYGDVLSLKDLQKYAGKPLGNPYATLEYKKHLFGPKRTLNIWNPDGKLSEADMKALMDYGLGSGWKQKGNKSKGSNSQNTNYNSSKSKSEKLSKTERIDQELMKDSWNKEHWDDVLANKRNRRIARRNFAFDNPEFRRLSDKIVFGAGRPGRIVGSGENARWEQQGNYYEKTERVKEKKNKSKDK